MAGGGARASYEVGVLSAIAERAPGLESPILTCVSAGATVRPSPDKLSAPGWDVDRD